jgi:hypothetical protein
MPYSEDTQQVDNISETKQGKLPTGHQQTAPPKTSATARSLSPPLLSLMTREALSISQTSFAQKVTETHKQSWSLQRDTVYIVVPYDF